MRKVSFLEARFRYRNRFTMEHVPDWAKKPCESNGLYYAPQYRSDREWYDNTVFPGEAGLHPNNKYCESNGQTWPLGQWRNSPFIKD